MDNFSILVKHGAAPYDFDDQNTGSYFAVLRDAAGQESTVWGVDIERSLQEAGAQVGDSLSLVRGDREPVVVQVRNDKGVVESKTVDRYVWHTQLEPFEMEIVPGKELQKDIAGAGIAGKAGEAGLGGVDKAGDGLYAVMAPYMLNGLHNHQGIALAERLNERIANAGLVGNKKGIQDVLDADPEAKRYLLAVVAKQRYLEDQHLRQNRSEPGSLLGGLFVRDEQGGYRPAAGGPVVLADKGDSLTLKGRGQDAYKAAIELAAAKGWTSIELKGKPAMMAGVWLEAQMMGVKVVNYTPTEKDLETLAERIAERDKLRAAERAAEAARDVVSPEHVEVREFVGGDGKRREATTVYTVSYEAEGDLASDKYDNPKDAGAAFAALPVSSRPMVMRAMTSVDGDLKSNIVAVTDALPGIDPVKSVDSKLDAAFFEAFELAVEAEKAQEVAVPPVELDVTKPGQTVTGKILKVEGGVVYQDRGCGNVFRHAADSLSRVPAVGSMEKIRYGQDGRGEVVEREIAREKGRELALG